MLAELFMPRMTKSIRLPSNEVTGLKTGDLIAVVRQLCELAQSPCRSSLRQIAAVTVSGRCGRQAGNCGTLTRFHVGLWVC